MDLSFENDWLETYLAEETETHKNEKVNQMQDRMNPFLEQLLKNFCQINSVSLKS